MKRNDLQRRYTVSRLLCEDLATLVENAESAISIPKHIKDNLSKRIALRPYQEEVLKYFLCYESKDRLRSRTSHLLFHMATGSGKTVIMGALILHFYQMGYRNFLFFVNSDNIVEKTKENFLSSGSSKYLFADLITIDGRKVVIQEVSNFEDASQDSINIHFTTTQGLHSNLNDPKENSITYEDFADKKVVLISDEAHHINASTKNKGKKTKGEKSWEETVQRIFDSNDNNFLLDFTATMDMNNENIRKKYEGKILYDYPLAKFRLDGYSKEVLLHRSHVSPLERMFQVVMFSQYRHKIAAEHGLSIKPVILMKSRRVEESKKNTADFINFIEGLKGEDIRKAQKRYAKDDRLGEICRYLFKEKGIKHDDFALELKYDFSDKKIINVNDPKELKKYQVKVNSLEDRDNKYRVVFAVDKLNEGWDVLNLFDIARLYETRETGKSTNQEAQLIGRGARYYPFDDGDNPDKPKTKRKYDKNTKHPLRVLEELHYHCYQDSKYVHEIRTALRKAGMLEEPEKKEVKVKEFFKDTDFYKKGCIYMNKRIRNVNKDRFRLSDYDVFDEDYVYSRILSSSTDEVSALRDSKVSAMTAERSSNIFLNDNHILRHVIDENKFFSFNMVKNYLPHINSMKDIFDEMNGISVRVRGDKKLVDYINRKNKRDIYRWVLSLIEKNIKSKSFEYKGTRDFLPYQVSDVVKDKHVYISNKNTLVKIEKEERWYVYERNFLTSLEKNFVDYVGEKASDIEKKCGEFYLIRNEGLVKLYRFEDGDGFEPDFLLFVINGKESVVYQLVIEQKGDHIEAKDAWKQKFLDEMNEMCVNMYESKKYKIVGLPFYTEKKTRNFIRKFEEILSI